MSLEFAGEVLAGWHRDRGRDRPRGRPPTKFGASVRVCGVWYGCRKPMRSLMAASLLLEQNARGASQDNRHCQHIRPSC
jgi:hypothetical protein